MFIKSLACVCFCLVLMSSSCKKHKEICEWSAFTFEHPVSVYPVKESYSLGDTIWFEMNFSDVFNTQVRNNIYGDLRSEAVQLKNFDFHRNFLRIINLTDSSRNINGQQTGTWDSNFDAIYKVGALLQELPDGPEYRLIYSDDYYHLKFGMVIKNKGNYIYYPIFKNYYPNAQNSLNAVEIRPECDVEKIEDIRFPVNRQSDGTLKSNYHLFEKYMNPALENDIERIKKECFTFVVK
jgi:hypothetical protein